MKITIALDMDGVLLDLMGGVREELRKQGKQLKTINDYNFKDQVYRKEIIEAINNPITFLNSEFYDYAEDCLYTLNQCKNIEYYIESLSLNKDIASVKDILLKTYFPEISVPIIHRINSVKEYKGADIVVEDNPLYMSTSTFIKSNHHVLVIRRSYNKFIKNSERITVLKSLKHLKETIVSIEKADHPLGLNYGTVV